MYLVHTVVTLEFLRATFQESLGRPPCVELLRIDDLAGHVSMFGKFECSVARVEREVQRRVVFPTNALVFGGCGVRDECLEVS